MTALFTPQHGGDRVAQALQAHGVPCVYTLCGGHISPILSAAKARGIRIVDVRDEATAVFAADAAARLSGLPGVAAVTAGPGITNTITALKNAQLAQSPLILIGGAAPTALQGRGALQDIDQRPLVEPHVKRFMKLRRVRELGPAVAEAFALAQAGVPGPVFIECPVDLLYDEANIRQWYADASGKGNSWSERALRWYLNRHVQRMFEGSAQTPAIAARPVSVPEASSSAVRATLMALAKAERPLMVIGSQAVVDATQAQALADAVGQLGIPVYLSGMARGLLGRNHPLHLRHQRRVALREADCVILAGVPCDFRLDYGKHVRRSATLIAANRSARDVRLNRRPDVAALGDAGAFIRALAMATHASEATRRAGWVASLRERDQAREVEIDQQAAARGGGPLPVGVAPRLVATPVAPCHQQLVVIAPECLRKPLVGSSGPQVAGAQQPASQAGRLADLGGPGGPQRAEHPPLAADHGIELVLGVGRLAGRGLRPLAGCGSLLGGDDLGGLHSLQPDEESGTRVDQVVHRRQGVGPPLRRGCGQCIQNGRHVTQGTTAARIGVAGQLPQRTARLLYLQVELSQAVSLGLGRVLGPVLVRPGRRQRRLQSVGPGGELFQP